jgi:hypothetical protein
LAAAVKLRRTNPPSLFKRNSLGDDDKATADKENPDELAPSGFDDLFYQLTF